MIRPISISDIDKFPLLPPDQMYINIPCGIRCLLLFKLMSRKEIGISKALPYIYEAYRQLNIMDKRNADAKPYEENNYMDEALNLFEQNLNDGFYRDFLYEHLYEIYMSAKKEDEALRVCKSYITLVDEIRTLNIEDAEIGNSYLLFKKRHDDLSLRKAGN